MKADNRTSRRLKITTVLIEKSTAKKMKELDAKIGSLIKARCELVEKANTPYMLGHWKKRENILRDIRRVKQEAWLCVEHLNQLKSKKA